MNEEHIITSKTGETKYLIQNIFRIRNGYFFSILNLTTFDMMFGEYNGILPEDDEAGLDMICEDFRNGCGHIVYPDAHIVEELYDMWGDFQI